VANFATGDWDALAEVIADNFSNDDRRRVVGAGVRHGRDAQIADMRTIADLWTTNVTPTVMATRGQRLALVRLRFWDRDQGPDAFLTEAVSILELNAEERAVALVSFDLDDIDAAFEELENRYLAGEAASHAHAWSVIVQSYSALKRGEVPVIPDLIDIDRRGGATALAPGDLIGYLREAFDDTDFDSLYVEGVHRLTSVGAVVTHVARGTSREGFDAEWRMVLIITVEGDAVRRGELFGEADLDAALARFEELQPQVRQLENAASALVERFWAYLTTRDWSGMAETMAVDFSSHDHRKVVNAGVLRGRDVNIANMRAVAGVGFEGLVSTVIATRGQRLVLNRIRSSAHGFGAGEISADMLGMLEIDADNRFTVGAIFDSDDIDAAFAELDARYLAGEAAAHERTWSLMRQTYAGFNRHEIPATAPDFVNIDHRRGITFEPGEIVPYVQATWDVAPDLKMFIETVHRLTDTGCIITHTAYGTSQEGFDAEWRETVFFTFEGDLIKRCEMFDEIDLDAALARFDRLNQPDPRLQNTASRVLERYFARFAARDWDVMAETLLDDFVTDDRRRVVNAGVRRGRDAEIENMQSFAEIGMLNITVSSVATRGERLVLGRYHVSFSDWAESPGDVTGVVEINTDNQIAAHIMFDADDIDEAFDELNARYLAGEAAAHAHTWSVVSGVPARFNRRELPATTPEPVYIDHRPLVSSEGADLAASIRAVWDITSDSSVHIEAVHQLSERGAVFTEVLKMTSQEGFDAEVRMIMLFAVEGGLINRVEVFDEADLDTALARFDELQAQTPRRPENAASRIHDRHFVYFRNRNWGAIAGILTDDSFVDDRRRVTSSGFWDGRDAVLANLRALADAAPAAWAVIATRGEQLAVTRICSPNRDVRQGEFSSDMLILVEINTDERIAAQLAFDVDDIDAALEELDARYLAGEAATYSRIWSAITRAYSRVNRHELPDMTPDSVLIDHRAVLTTESEDLAGYLPSLWNLTPDISVFIEAVHRLSDLGGVVTQVTHGTSQDGFDAEWRAIVVGILEGDLYTRAEAFDEADLDAALARFDELTTKDKPK
jgi:hypothetical protein